jgi:hypothetical protein
MYSGLYEEAMGKLEELQGMFLALDGVSAEYLRSLYKTR